MQHKGRFTSFHTTANTKFNLGGVFYLHVWLIVLLPAEINVTFA